MTKALETQKIDVGPLFMDGNAVAPTLNAEIAAALRDDGSFVAVGLPDSKGLAGRSADLLAFFTFPEAVRHPLAVRKHRASSINIYRGYYPPPAGRHWSYNENFDIGPEPPLPVSDGPGTEGLREANVWPAEPAFKPWREAMLAFAGDCRRAATVILAAAARGLELDPERLLRPSRGRNGTLRLLHYPSIPPHFDLMEQMEEDEDPPADGRRILGRRHIDTGLLSLLWQDAGGGLQMQGRDRVWRDVPAETAGLSVHCGDLLAALSQGTMPATPHRVLGSGKTARHSIGYFLEPGFRTEVMTPDAAKPRTYANHLIGEFPGRFEPPGDSQEA